MPGPKCDSLGGMDNIPRHSIKDLCRKSPRGAPDDRFAFPHRFRDGEIQEDRPIKHREDELKLHAEMEVP